MYIIDKRSTAISSPINYCSLIAELAVYSLLKERRYTQNTTLTLDILKCPRETKFVGD